MSQVNIILTDKEDGTLGVQIIADQDEGKAHAVAVMFMDMLHKMNEAKIITES